MCASLLIILAFACEAPAAAPGDRIVPSDRVVNSVTVRELPSGDSSKVGELTPGESAAYAGAVPGWYEVLLADGTPGFVSDLPPRFVPVPMIVHGCRSRRFPPAGAKRRREESAESPGGPAADIPASCAVGLGCSAVASVR